MQEGVDPRVSVGVELVMLGWGPQSWYTGGVCRVGAKVGPQD